MKLFLTLLFLLFSTSIFANTVLSDDRFQPLRSSEEKCFVRYTSFIEMSDSEEYYDIKYALLSYFELRALSCPINDDDLTIAQYDLERIKNYEDKMKKEVK